MKIIIPLTRRSVGYALTIVFVFCAIAIIILAGTVKRTATTAALNERENQLNRTYFAAQAAVEKSVGMMLADYRQGQDAYVKNNLTNYCTNLPTSTESTYWANYQFTDGAAHVGKTYVKLIVAGSANWVTDQTDGLSRWRTIYRVLSNAKELNSRFSITNAAQQDMALDTIPVFQFAIFYNSALEFTWAAPFVINGRVHANGPIYTGVSSSSSLTFNSLISTTSTLTKKALGGYTVANMTGTETYSGGQKTNNITLSLPIGTNSAYEIINIPPAGEDVNSALGTNRYYNKAGMVLLISNTAVTAIIKSSASDNSPIVLTYTNSDASLATNLPFLTLTNRMVDQREGKTNVISQIDVGKFTTWASGNSSVATKRPSSNPLGVLYVADQRTVNANQLDSIRLTHATTIPSFGSGSGVGFTIATPNPLYILGNYNTPNSSDAPTNTSHASPASLVSDALTILSTNWSDSRSISTAYHSSPTSFNAYDTVINAAILTGVVYSTGTDSSTFSGGVHNLPRLLEDWTGDNLYLNTSIVNLYASAKATNQFKLPDGSGAVGYYNAPTRKFSFDNNFTDPAKQPPGSPSIGEIKRNQWASPPPDRTDYASP